MKTCVCVHGDGGLNCHIYAALQMIRRIYKVSTPNNEVIEVSCFSDAYQEDSIFQLSFNLSNNKVNFKT